MSNPLSQLTSAGVSIWLDDLSRARIESGNLAKLINDFSVRGVTTNPTIFAAALSNGEVYASAVKQAKVSGLTAGEAIAEITSRDVADACDLFSDIYRESAGVDGRVSIEVEPELANDAAGTIKQALELYKLVNRENVMIKIPATKPGLEAITAVTAKGISVNVTLIFSVERYDEVIDAYFKGLELALEAGLDIGKIHSVASFFVSRVDTEVDKRLSAIGSSQAESLKSKAALANARLAYELFEKRFSSTRWQQLASKGARLQRPLMASTGVKDPALPDTLYVTELVAPNLVNTMPEKTMMATHDHGIISGDTITSNYDLARKVMSELSEVGIDFANVTAVLETEGVEKFIVSWNELVETVNKALEAA